MMSVFRPVPQLNSSREEDAPRSHPSPFGESRLAPGACASWAFLPGYRFLTCLSRTPLMETWRAETPEGQPRLIQLVDSFGKPEEHLDDAALDRLRARGFGHLDNRGADAALAHLLVDGGEGVGRWPNDQQLTQLLALSHPGLSAVELLRREPGRLVLETELYDQTLRAYARAYRTRGQPGIPRAELIAHLRRAAEILDDLVAQYGLRHFGLNPDNLVLVDEELRVMENGLVPLIWLPGGWSAYQFNVRYAAPELYVGHTNSTCDPYSLALIYLELLTDTHPHRGQTRRQLATSGWRGKLDLSVLSTADAQVLTRALSTDPDERFRSCTALIEALQQASAHQSGLHLALTDDALSPAEALATRASPLANVTLASPSLFISALVESADSPPPLETARSFRYAIRPDGTLEHHYQTRLLPSLVRMKLAGFCREWQANLRSTGEGSFLIDLTRTGTFWQRCLGWSPRLKVSLSFSKPKESSGGLVEVSVVLQPLDCSKAQGVRLVEQVGPTLLEDLRSYLHVLAERREHQRLPCSNAVCVVPTQEEGGLIEATEGLALNVSLSGIGILLPYEIPADQVLIRLPASARETALAVAAQLVRWRRWGEEVYEVGARFVSED